MPSRFYNITGGKRRKSIHHKKSKKSRKYRRSRKHSSKRHYRSYRERKSAYKSRKVDTERIIGQIQQNIESQLIKANNAAHARIIMEKERRHPMTRRDIRALQRIRSRSVRRTPNPCRGKSLRKCPKDSCIKRKNPYGRRVCTRRPGWRPAPPAQPTLIEQLTTF